MNLFRERYGFQRPLEKWVKILGVLSVVLAVIYSIVFLHNIMTLTTYPGAGKKITKECIGINSPKCNGGLPNYHLTALQIRVASVVVAVARLGIEIWMCKTLVKAASHGDGSALKDWYWKRAVYTISDITFGMILPEGVYSVMWIVMNLTFYSYHVFVLLVVHAYWKHLELP